jgi:hypothetical protein
VRKLKLTLIGALAAMALAASTLGAGPSAATTAKPAYVRVIHNFFSDAVPAPARVDIKAVRPGVNIGAAAPVATIGYGTITRYLRLPSSGDWVLGVFLAGTNTKVAEVRVTLGDWSRTTVLARRTSTTNQAFKLEFLADGFPRRPPAGQANVRVIHGIAAAAADNVNIGAAGVGCLLTGVSFPANATLNVPAGTYTVGVYPGSDTTCSGAPLPGLSATLTLNANTAYTVIAQFNYPAPGFRLKAVQDQVF